MVAAVVFDLDGVLVESEQLWDAARRAVAAAHGGRWREAATRAMQGMSAPEWARYMREEIGVRLEAHQINRMVVNAVINGYHGSLPLLPGAVEAVNRLAEWWPLGIASSANLAVIEEVLRIAELRERFAIVVSSEEVARGKPAPDVYVEAARRLGEEPSLCVAIEDSANGIRSAVAAAMNVVAIPNREYPPPPDVVEQAAVVLDGLDALTPEVVAGL